MWLDRSPDAGIGGIESGRGEREGTGSGRFSCVPLRGGAEVLSDVELLIILFSKHFHQVARSGHSLAQGMDEEEFPGWHILMLMKISELTQEQEKRRNVGNTLIEKGKKITGIQKRGMDKFKCLERRNRNTRNKNINV